MPKYFYFKVKQNKHGAVVEHTNADVVEVVRCEDCKWYQPDADKWCGYFECMGFEPDDYCSQGEWKDGDSND